MLRPSKPYEAVTVLIKPGDGGIYGQRENSSITTYSYNMRSMFWRLEENGYAILATRNQGISMIHLPMLSLTIRPDKYSKCPTPSEVLMGGLEGEWGIMANAVGKGWSGLDEVGLDLYIAMIRKLGAKVGQRIGDEIVWDDGQRTQILDSEQIPKDIYETSMLRHPTTVYYDIQWKNNWSSRSENCVYWTVDLCNDFRQLEGVEQKVIDDGVKECESSGKYSREFRHVVADAVEKHFRKIYHGVQLLAVSRWC